MPLYVLLPFATACHELRNDEELGKKLIASAQKKKVLDLSEITSFTWENVVILTPYYPLDEAAKELDIDLSPVRSAYAKLTEDRNVLVFLHNRKAVHLVACPRTASEFVSDTLRLIPRRSAKFSINLTDPPNTYGPRWVELTLIN